MSKKDYELVAKAINAEWHASRDKATLQVLVDRFCIAFKQENNLFKPEVFKTACFKEAK